MGELLRSNTSANAELELESEVLDIPGKWSALFRNETCVSFHRTIEVAREEGEETRRRAEIEARRVKRKNRRKTNKRKKKNY